LLLLLDGSSPPPELLLVRWVGVEKLAVSVVLDALFAVGAGAPPELLVRMVS